MYYVSNRFGDSTTIFSGIADTISQAYIIASTG